MADSCATCFFFRAVMNEDRGECHLVPPAISYSGSSIATAWPLVLPTEWCGEGIDGTSTTPFNAPMVPVTPTSTSFVRNQFTMSAQDTITVTDANCKVTSTVKIWAITTDHQNVSLVATPGAGSFGVATSPDTNVTGTYGYTILN